MKNKIQSINEIVSLIFLRIDTNEFIYNLSDVFAGQSPPQVTKYWVNGTTPFLNINNLTNNFYVIDSKVFVNEIGMKKYKCKLTTEFSILVGKVSPNKDKISVVNKGFVVNGAIRIIEIKKKENYAQVFYGLREKAYILSKIASGSVQQQINSSQLLKLNIKFNYSHNDIFNLLLDYQKVCWKLINLIHKIKNTLIKIYI